MEKWEKTWLLFFLAGRLDCGMLASWRPLWHEPSVFFWYQVRASYTHNWGCGDHQRQIKTGKMAVHDALQFITVHEEWTAKFPTKWTISWFVWFGTFRNSIMAAACIRDARLAVSLHLTLLPTPPIWKILDMGFLSYIDPPHPTGSARKVL